MDTGAAGRHDGLGSWIKETAGNEKYQKITTGILTLIIAFVLIQNGALHKKYKIHLGERSPYDISAPRDIENTLKTEQNARLASEAVPPEMTRINNVPVDVINQFDDFITTIDQARKTHSKKVSEAASDTMADMVNDLTDANDPTDPTGILSDQLAAIGIMLDQKSVDFLLITASDEDILLFKKTARELISGILNEEITEDNLVENTDRVISRLAGTDLADNFKTIGSILVKSIIKPNSAIDVELTKEKRDEVYNSYLKNKDIIKKDTRIVSFGDIITEDKLRVLEELNLIESGKPDYLFSAGILAVLVLLMVLLLFYIRQFVPEILHKRTSLVILAIISVVTIASARILVEYSPLLIPIFMATMLVSILLDIKIALAFNFVLSIAIYLMTKGDPSFIFISLIGGTFSAFFVHRANQRMQISISGLFVAGINILITISLGLVNKNGFNEIAMDSLYVSTNGIVSVIMTIGMLPFMEGIFNVVTPLKLLELANPNQTLIKRLLMEAPGTYHHSLMVGNLAEAASSLIGGDSLLSRVGAYYHDIGKLKRPGFFKENQLTDNPHERMTANLSTLIITSHTHDGVELADKYRLPQIIKDMIVQHHGNSLVAYFYHKAKKGEKKDIVRQDDFRYQSPKPTTREAAVVMLADSVEAAVRSLPDKTEGRIEGLVRKIIKDKLDDGQLDHCELTLGDLDKIAKGFMSVFSGFFHAREIYPEVRARLVKLEEKPILDPLDVKISENLAIATYEGNHNVKRGGTGTGGRKHSI